MRFAVGLETDDYSSLVFKRFARAPFFGIIDTVTKQYSIVANDFFDSKEHAGKLAVDMLCSECNISCFIAFELGLKVQQLAKKMNVQQIILNNDKQTFDQILSLLKVE